jgi:phosphate transport system substrate-binding protein
MKSWQRCVIGLMIVALGATRNLGQAVKSGPRHPRVPEDVGRLRQPQQRGSDTMNNLMALWGEAFQKMYPNVKIQIEGRRAYHRPRSSQAPQFGPMSRP